MIRFEYRIDPQLSLAPLELFHTPMLFALTDSHRGFLRRWLPWVDSVQTEADSESFIISSQRQWAMNNGYTLGIWCDDQLAGVVGHNSIAKTHRACTVGYWLAESFNHRGLMTRSVQALAHLSFGVLELNRMEIRCATANWASRNIPERLKFQLEGVIRDAEWLYDQYVDHAVYAMLARDWKE